MRGKFEEKKECHLNFWSCDCRINFTLSWVTHLGGCLGTPQRSLGGVEGEGDLPLVSPCISEFTLVRPDCRLRVCCPSMWVITGGFLGVFFVILWLCFVVLALVNRALAGGSFRNHLLSCDTRPMVCSVVGGCMCIQGVCLLAQLRCSGTDA